MLKECAGDRKAATLADSAIRCMTWRGGDSEFPYLSTANMRILVSHFFLAPGRRYFLSEVSFKWNSQTDRARIPLPSQLGFLYHFLRLPLWLGRCCKRLTGMSAA